MAKAAKIIQIEDPDQQLISEINDLYAKALEAEHKVFRIHIEIGQKLAEKKASLGHSKLTPWVKENLSFSVRHASNYLRIYENRKSLEEQIGNGVSDLSLRSALELLPSKKKSTETLACSTGCKKSSEKKSQAKKRSTFEEMHSQLGEMRGKVAATEKSTSTEDDRKWIRMVEDETRFLQSACQDFLAEDEDELEAATG